MNSSTAELIALKDAEKKAVQQQLERLLSNPHFSQSRRFPSFLRFVIEQTLDGRPEMLKERTLGIEIFGRRADYDTASDPIVRVTATEIRKRIAQYYQEPGHETELRLSLPAGSYVPQFHWPHPAQANAPVEATVASHPLPIADPAVVPAVPVTSAQPPLWRPIAGLAFAAIAVLLLAGGGLLWRHAHRAPSDFFWGPVVDAGEPVLFCIADQSPYPLITLRDAADPAHKTELKDDLTTIVIDDLIPVVRLAGMLQSNGRKFSVKGQTGTDLSDLRNGPTVFIGAFDNAWTLRLTSALRYHFANNPDMSEFRIVDSASPEHSSWVINRQHQTETNNYRDFAIVARFTDGTTGKVAVVAAGVGRGGTRVAGEYLTDLGDLAQLAARAGDKRNVEVVLSTQIIDGEPGKPKVEASYFW